MTAPGTGAKDPGPIPSAWGPWAAIAFLILGSAAIIALAAWIAPVADSRHEDGPCRCECQPGHHGAGADSRR
jgi:hypothetical protein